VITQVQSLQALKSVHDPNILDESQAAATQIQMLNLLKGLGSLVSRVVEHRPLSSLVRELTVDYLERRHQVRNGTEIATCCHYRVSVEPHGFYVG